MSLAHGTILGGLSTVPDLDSAIDAYRDVLKLELVESGQLSAPLAASWGAEVCANARFATFRPASGAPCWLRLVEQADLPAFEPTTSFGWGAYELTVQNVYGWPARLSESAFKIVGQPRALPGMDAFVPMQVLGPGRELLYLNEVFVDMAQLDLPRAESLTDHVFIVILASPDRVASCAWYGERLGLDVGETIRIPYRMINTAFGLSDDHITALTMIQSGRLPIVEIDGYPAQAGQRPRHAGMLPPGNALVTLGVRDLDGCRCDWIVEPESREGALYEGRRAATTIGLAGELLELVEIG